MHDEAYVITMHAYHDFITITFGFITLLAKIIMEIKIGACVIALCFYQKYFLLQNLFQNIFMANKAPHGQIKLLVIRSNQIFVMEIQ